MPASKKGYRADRLRRRRRTRAELWQAWVLYALAGVVAFGAVLGAWHLGSRWLKTPEEQAKPGYLALVILTASGSGDPAAAALVVKDAAGGAPALYVIPKELLLEGPNGEYVFAGDALAAGTLKQDLQRVVGAEIDAQYQLPLKALDDLSAAGAYQITLRDPVELDLAGTQRAFKEGHTIVSAAEVPALFAASGPNGYDAWRMQEALWNAVLDAAALRPDDARAKAATAAAASASGSADTRSLVDALRGLTNGDAVVDRIPSRSRMAEGQFAFLPRRDDIMAAITRKAPGFRSPYTVVVRNGSGRAGRRPGRRRASRHTGRQHPGADQCRHLRLPPDADPAGQPGTPGGRGHPCYTRPRSRPRRRGCATRHGRRHRRRRLQAQASRPKGPAVALHAELTTAEELARDIAGHAADKKAEDIVVLAMGDAVSWTDFFVIVTGANPRQTKAIAQEIEGKLRLRRHVARVEGEREAEWILLDFIDVVVHVFTPASRAFYRLETLWGDVPRLDLAVQG